MTAFLVGRRYLANTLSFAILAAGGTLGILGSFPSVVGAFVFIALVGLAGTVFNITSRTLWQRAAPPDAIAGSFSVLEALMDFGLALGAVLVRVAIAIDGIRAAVFAPAIVAFVLVALLWGQLRRIDASANVPHVEIQLLRSIPIFAPLPAPTLEGLARELVAVQAPRGTVVISQDDQGDRYYAVADGSLEIVRDGRLVQTASRGRRLRRDRPPARCAPDGVGHRHHRFAAVRPRKGALRANSHGSCLRGGGRRRRRRPASCARPAKRRRRAARDRGLKDGPTSHAAALDRAAVLSITPYGVMSRHA